MQYPMYLTAQQAAEYTGIGEKQIREWMHSITPPPMLEVGRKRLIERDGLPEYLRSKQIGRAAKR